MVEVYGKAFTVMGIADEAGHMVFVTDSRVSSTDADGCRLRVIMQE